MNELDLEKINKERSEAGRIYWRYNYNWSSRILDNLFSQGYRIKKSGIRLSLCDKNNNELSSGLTRIELLCNLDHQMR